MDKKYKIHKGAVITSVVLCSILFIGVFLVRELTQPSNIGREIHPLTYPIACIIAFAPLYLGSPYLVYRYLKKPCNKE